MAEPAKDPLCLHDDDQPALVVFGKQGKDPARGAWFPAAEAEAARAGAASMGLDDLAVTDAASMALAERVPKGRVFEQSGKLFTPRIQKTVYEQLADRLPKGIGKSDLTHAEETADPDDTPQSDDDTPSPTETAVSGVPLDDWAKLAIGSLVLALDEHDECWYLAIVQAIATSGEVTLAWRDYPDEDLFTQPLALLALLHPGIDPDRIAWEAA